MLRRVIYLAVLSLGAALVIVPARSSAQLPSMGGGSTLGTLMQLLPLVTQFAGGSSCASGASPTLGGDAGSQFRDVQHALGGGSGSSFAAPGMGDGLGQLLGGSGFGGGGFGGGDLQSKFQFVLQAMQQAGGPGGAPGGALPSTDMSRLSSALEGSSQTLQLPATSTSYGHSPPAQVPPPGPKTIHNPFVKRKSALPVD